MKMDEECGMYILDVYKKYKRNQHMKQISPYIDNM